MRAVVVKAAESKARRPARTIAPCKIGPRGADHLLYFTDLELCGSLTWQNYLPTSDFHHLSLDLESAPPAPQRRGDLAATAIAKSDGGGRRRAG